MARISVRATIPAADIKALNEALLQLPGRFRGKAAMKAFKRSGQPLLQAVKAVAAREVNSKSLPQSFAIYNGKHSRKGDPYVVLMNKKKNYPHRRNVRGAFSSIGQTNWFNIGHLVYQGTSAGPRRAGTSVRQERAGRNRMKLFKTTGQPAYERKSTTGRYFIVVSAQGIVHPLKTISHRGTSPTRIFEKALNQGARPATDKFAEYARDEVARIRTKILRR